MTTPTASKEKQEIILGFGRELESLADIAFRDPCPLAIVGVYPDLGNARPASMAKAHSTVRNAHRLHFRLHRTHTLHSKPP